MSEQPLTDESAMEMFRETDRLIQSIARRQDETARKMKETDRKISALDSPIGEIIEHMVVGNNIIRKFQALDYNIEAYSRNQKFGHGLPQDMRGEIGLLLENGNIAILVEVKTTLQTKDVAKHIERLEKYRHRADYKGDKRRFIGAVAGSSRRRRCRRIRQ